MDLYRDQLLDHYKHPRNFFSMEDATHHAHADNPLCGDDLDIWLKVENDNITDISFQAQSCAITMGTASLITEELKGQPLAKAQNLNLDQILEILGTPLTATRQQCAQVVLTALQKALS